ncbi:MAG TPA: putative toxin-antitoxin system toxin component, PIN family [Burkholderiales bacterium]
MRIVLDTNVLVSLLVFRDPRYAAIWSAWVGGELTVMSDVEVAAELARVLEYPQFAARCDPASVYEAYRCRVQMRGPHAPIELPRCRDEDDQKFLLLAAAGAADVLVTDDKALLRLRRKLRFAIERPAAFLRRLSA